MGMNEYPWPDGIMEHLVRFEYFSIDTMGRFEFWSPIFLETFVKAC